jgi:hypothetical protein
MPADCVVVGAPYGTASRFLGADDDAGGVAALVALAYVLRDRPLARSVRLVAFVDEEPPHARRVPETRSAHGTRRARGSVRYVDDLLRTGPRVVAMVSLEGLGVYTKPPWPLRLLPPFRSDGVAFVGDLGARQLVRRAAAAFAAARPGIVARTVNLPLFVTGVRSSDHVSFSRRGIPAFGLTDAGPLRARSHHAPGDSADRLDYERLVRATLALAAVVRELAGSVPETD